MSNYFRCLLFRIVFYVCAIISFCGCNNSEFYDLGEGFRYGYFMDNKATLNVYYNDAGIVHGICYSVEWNGSYILMRYYPFDSTGSLLHTSNACLIDKKAYIKKPVQMESEAISFGSEDSILHLLHLRKIYLVNRQSINP